MAQKVSVELVDDLDGSPADETITFTIEGKSFEIDLNKKNAAAFRKSFEKYAEAGRRASRSGGAKRQSNRPDYNRADFKAWAAKNKITLGRGRPPRDVLDKFLAS